jgi:hypothetical protein
MAICEDCNREMSLAASCTFGAVMLAGERFERDRHRARRGAPDATMRCHDCGVRPGGFHHLGCDMERCPRCRGQLFCCDCWGGEADEDDDAGSLVGVEGLEPPG